MCISILEEKSGLIHGKDFHVGCYPERINAVDKVNQLEIIVKIDSSDDNITDEMLKFMT